MFCQNCGNRLDDDAKFCDVCGTKVDGVKEVVNMVNEDPQINNFADIQQKPEAIAPVADPQPLYNEVPPVNNAAPVAKSAAKKGKAGLKIAICIIVIVAVIAGGAAAVFANVDKLPASVKRLVQSDEEYYIGVENERIQETANQVTELYSTMLSTAKENPLDKAVGLDFGMSLTIDQKGKDLLESLINLALVEEGIISSGDELSLDSLSSISVDSSMGYSDNVAGVLASFSYGKDQIVSVQVILDFDEQYLYVEIPELNRKAMMIDMSDYLPDMSEFEDVVDEYMDQLSVLVESLPDEKVLNKFVTKYIETALNCIEDVETESVTLEISDVKVKCTEYSVSFSERDSVKVCMEVLKELSDDEDFEEICISCITAACEIQCMNDSWYESYIKENYGSEEKYAKEQFEYFLEEIEEGYDYLKENSSDFDKSKVIHLKTFIDGKGNIVGREISTDEEIADFSLFYCEAVSGSKQGFELKCEAEGVSVTLSGNGSYSKNLLSGDYTLSVNPGPGEKMYSIVDFGLKDFDTESIKKGYINGSVTISPNIDERIMEMIGDEMYLDSMSSYIIEQLLSAALTFKFEMNENGIAVTTTPSYNGILGSLNVYVKKTDKTFSVPKSSDCVEIYDEYDLEEWIETVDVNGFVKSIKKIEILNDIASLFDVDLNSIFEFVEDMDGEDIIDLLDMFY